MEVDLIESGVYIMLIQKYLLNRALNPKPLLHLLLVEGPLRWNYAFPRRTQIIIENLERIPQDRAVILAMNHTNIYNYVPFLYQLFREYKAQPERGFPSFAFWAKAHFFHHPLAGKLLATANVIPLPSRGYLLAHDFQDTFDRIPTHAEYRLLRDLIDRRIELDPFLVQANRDLVRFVTTPHGEFDPHIQSYYAFIERQYNRLMRLVTRTSEQALLKQRINLLIFPEGGISFRLRQGQVGLAQIALKTGAPIVPIGANGLDKLYPDLWPFSRGGQALYRVGQPLSVADELAPFAINQPFEPFSRAAQNKFGDRFRAATDLIMERINALLDPPYQFSPDAPPPERQGAERFVW